MAEPASPPAPRSDLRREIRRNEWRTSVMLLTVGALTRWSASCSRWLGLGLVALVVFLAVAVGVAAGSWLAADRVALAVTYARPADGPDYLRFHNLTEGLCIAAGLPKPRLFVIDDDA